MPFIVIPAKAGIQTLDLCSVCPIAGCTSVPEMPMACSMSLRHRIGSLATFLD
jgi:hypothetical protein